MSGSGMFNFNLPISKTGEHLKVFAKTLDDMVKQWDTTRMKFLEKEQRECRSASQTESTTTSTAATPSTTTVKYSSDASPTASSTTTTTTTVAPKTPAVIVNKPAVCNQSTTPPNPIPALNVFTRKSMTDFGVQVPRLRPLITGLWIGLNFNPYTQKGAALYNYNENVSTVAANLKLLSKEIARMAVEWEQMVTVKACPEPEPVIDVNIDISANVSASTEVPAAQTTSTSSVLRRLSTGEVKG